MRMEGASSSDSIYRAAASRSSTLDEKLESEKSPSLSPRPVKSKRTTAIPSPDNVRVMSTAARMFFEQVKQCAKRAYATGRPFGGTSRRAARS